MVVAVVVTQIEEEATTGRHHRLLGVVEAGEVDMRGAAALMTTAAQLVVAATAVVLVRAVTSHPGQVVVGGRMMAMVDGEEPTD